MNRRLYKRLIVETAVYRVFMMIYLAWVVTAFY